jgi:hypothetical protein
MLISGVTFCQNLIILTKGKGVAQAAATPTKPLIRMHSCYSPMILYGFYDHGAEKYEIISKEYLERNYPNLCLYANDVIRNCGTEYVIGIYSSISEDGKVSYYSHEAYDELMRFIAKYEKHHHVNVTCKYIPVIVGDYENSEYAEYQIDEVDDDDDATSLISSDESSRPSTPINQRTRPASTNAPARSVECQGCADEQPNQMAHMGAGGCLKYDSD